MTAIATQEERPAAAPPPTTPIVFEAIVKKLAIVATYNRGEVTLAPHVIYTRHGEIYVDALTIERDGKPPKEIKMGAFKLAGLSPLRLTARRFTISDLFHRHDSRYAGVQLMAVTDD